MVIVSLTCPKCQGDIELDDSREFGFCQYCGNKIALVGVSTKKIQVDQSGRAKNLLLTAEDYFEEGFKEKAYRYASEAVELDRSLAKAWYIIAMCTEDFEERVIGFKNAMKNTDDPELKDLIEKQRGQKYRVKLRPSKLLTSWMSEEECPILIDGKKYVVNTTESVILDKGEHHVEFVFTNGVSSPKEFIVTRNCTLFLNVKTTLGYTYFSAEVEY